MKLYSQDQIAKRISELQFKILGKSHLYLDTCNDCGMPFIQAFKSYRRTNCEDCRSQLKLKKTWKSKVETLHAEGLLK